jgi:adenosine kinase
MKALICGSYAYDTIMEFNDEFKHQILPEQLDNLNVAFLVPNMRREFGGCAGNIAYNLNLISNYALPMGTVGKDFQVYAEWINKCNINSTYISKISAAYTAQAFITTDAKSNQITAFHPGAMNNSEHNKISDAQDENITIGIISPDGKNAMIVHAQQFIDAKIPFIFDPGQGLPMFDGAELVKFIQQATWVIVNFYEAQMLMERTGLTQEQITSQVEAFIITDGNNGSTIYTKNKNYDIPIAKPKVINDPTGCGDAYRGGLLFGLLEKLDWQVIGHIAALMGAIKIEYHGTQNHSYDLIEFKQKFNENFHYDF